MTLYPFYALLQNARRWDDLAEGWKPFGHEYDIPLAQKMADGAWLEWNIRAYCIDSCL